MEDLTQPYAARTHSLADYRGRRLVFCWYLGDFTFVCPTALLALSDWMDEFTDLDAGNS